MRKRGREKEKETEKERDRERERDKERQSETERVKEGDRELTLSSSPARRQSVYLHLSPYDLLHHRHPQPAPRTSHWEAGREKWKEEGEQVNDWPHCCCIKRARTDLL